MKRGRAGLALALAAALAGCAASGTPPGGTPLRTGTSGDYPPFSLASAGAPDGVDGFDVALVRRFGDEHGRAPAFARFTWPSLAADVAADRFELAAGGITVRPERSLVGRFSVPLAETGAVVLVREDSAARDLAALDRDDVTLAVNAGGHLERAARARFPRARILAIPDNAAVRAALLEGRADGAVTDTVEAPLWRRDAGALRTLGPFTHDRKAWLVAADRPDLSRAVDAWLLAREADGTLAAMRTRWLGAGASPPTARPLGAVLAAIDERMALMPLVAESKRRSGRPVHDPGREQRVVAAAQASAREAATRLGLAPPPDGAVDGVFEAMMAAAREIETATLAAAPASGAPAPDLDAELRPALNRIGERIAEGLVRLDAPLPREAVRGATREALRSATVSAEASDAIADAIVRLAEAPRAVAPVAPAPQ